MQLTGEEIRKRGYVKNAHDDAVRRASVDLTVGSTIIGGKQNADSSVRIEPQQMFVLVSAEQVHVPAGYAASALPKTGLCNKGILCINTGIIDTGYKGLISTTAINFGREPYLISVGEPFLRVVFHPLEGENALLEPKASGQRDDEYIRESRRNSIRFPGQFMDVPGQIEQLTQRISSDLLTRQTNDLLKWVGVLSLIFVLWNLGAYVLLQRQATISAAPTRADSIRAQQFDSLRAEVRSMAAQLDSVRRQPPVPTPVLPDSGPTPRSGSVGGTARADRGQLGAVGASPTGPGVGSGRVLNNGGKTTP